MSKSNMSISSIEPKNYVNDMIEFTNNFVSSSSCDGMQLIANKNDNNLYSTAVVANESDFKYQPKKKSSLLVSELDFDSLLTLTNEMYRIIGSKNMNPALIINNCRGDRVLVNFQMMGQWNFAIRDLSKEQLEIMTASLNTIQAELLANKKTR